MSGLPSQAYLAECLDYDPATGVLTWKERPRHHFASQRGRSVANTRYAGTPAFAVRHSAGYLNGNIRVGGKAWAFYAHRVIWKLIHGEEPVEIDHINRDKTDNRLSNLRAVTPRENRLNMPLRRDNKTGVCGVHAAPGGRWHVRIDGKYQSAHATKAEAIAARSALEVELGYVS